MERGRPHGFELINSAKVDFLSVNILGREEHPHAQQEHYYGRAHVHKILHDSSFLFERDCSRR